MLRFSPWIVKVAQSGSQTRIATENSSLCVADEILKAFAQLDRQIPASLRMILTSGRNFCETRRRQTDLESGGGVFRRKVLSPLPDPIIQNQYGWGKKEKPI